MTKPDAVAALKVQKPPLVVPARVRRLTLASVKSGIVDGPIRLLIVGVDGVGKSTFAANAPAPIFIGTEDGTDHLSVARFPAPDSWQDVLDAVDELTIGEHEFQTVVLDSLDWAEPLLWAHICERERVKSIEEVGGGYGKGYGVAIDEWRKLIAALERMQRAKGVGVITIAHSFIKKFQNPEGNDFDRYTLKLQDKAAGLWREWSKGVYFANYETFAVADKAKRVRGVSSGARLLYTARTASYDAKDRYGLPEKLPLSFEEFDRARRVGRPSSAHAIRGSGRCAGATGRRW